MRRSGWRRRRQRAPQQRDRAQPERRAQPENSVHADCALQRRRADQRQQKYRADADAEYRHRRGALFGARQVGGQCQRRGRNRAAALNGAAENQHFNGLGERRDRAAEREHQQAGGDHRLAPEAVGGHAERNLQRALRRAIHAEREADQQRRTLRHARGMRREHRQQQKQAGHAQRENSGEHGDCFALGGVHGSGGRGEEVARLAAPRRCGYSSRFAHRHRRRASEHPNSRRAHAQPSRHRP